ncbi:zinc finger, CCHC-type containing protein [Tanacetum coccineum]
MKKKKLSQGASTSGSTGKGVISVHGLFDDGFINRFDENNVISFSKNNLVYFMAVPRDGIFEIDMSCSNTNDSSMFAISNKRAKINLDSSLLWHCRLGHISKKRIEKLQHDELLNSIDIESLGKCVLCMSGKMARKPYSHQVKRAKDLLGLIHTDVCGPFRIVSRQGAKYFVTFTDDFSCYGYVYVLKHKHEVFETFKNDLIDLKASRSVEDLELIQEEDTNPSVDTSLDHEDDDQEINEPQSDINPIHRSTRTRRPTDRLCLYVDAEEHKLGDLVELPPNASNHWVAKWVIQKKRLTWGGAIYVFKARLCSKDFTQTLPGLIMKKPFLLVADPIRAISTPILPFRCISDFGGVTITSRFQQNPGEEHWTAVKNILKYLRNTKDMFLLYGGNMKRELRVSCYTDAGYLTDADDLRS